MPKASAHFTFSRRWQILERLPTRGPGLTAAELAAHLRHDCGFSVTKRTVERDLVELSAHSPITSNSDTKPFRWRWIEGKRPDLAGLDLADALSLVLAERMITPLLPASLLQALAPRFALARSKLATLGSHQFARWTEKVRCVPAALHLQPPRVPPEVLARVQEALLRETCITIAYLGPQDPKAKDLTLHPLGFIQRGPVPYLVATAFDYDDIRLYALHRMTRPRLPDTARRVPPGYSLDAYIKSGALDFGAGDTIILKARISDELAIYLAETPLAPDQTITHRDGAYQLAATVRDSWQLHFWIMSQGAGITVQAPRPLGIRVRNEHRDSLRNYDVESIVHIQPPSNPV